jgi:hypothetical protein
MIPSTQIQLMLKDSMLSITSSKMSSQPEQQVTIYESYRVNISLNQISIYANLKSLSVEFKRY